ncbi:MAG: hypothetical protein J0M15_16195 [Deltaproteobacteria bacterium]|nr:hypothetical protein [Deltaproteobacteria bacterium]
MNTIKPIGNLSLQLRLIIVVLILLLESSCRKEEKSLPQNKSPEVLKINSTSLYPHNVEFSTTSLHGKVYQDNVKSCQNCHGSDLKGGSSKISCTSCHNSFPHSQDFKTTQLHGSAYLKDKSSCTQCHGSDHKGGSVQISCQNCHSYPHDNKWALPQNHGVKFAEINGTLLTNTNPLERENKACMKCHENKPMEESSFKNRHPEHFVSCSSCHADMPHGRSFLSDDGTETIRHAKYLKEHPEKKGSCYSCHLNPERKVPELKTCLKCHDEEPESSYPKIQFKKEEEPPPPAAPEIQAPNAPEESKPETVPPPQIPE